MANYPLPERTPTSASSRRRATRRGLPKIRTKAPRRTRTRPSLPSFLRNIGPGSSGNLPLPGPDELVLHRHPDETSWKPSKLPTGKWRAPWNYRRSRRTNFPPWSGRAGAPGEGQSRLNLPPPRRLTGDRPCFNNKGNNKRNHTQKHLYGRNYISVYTTPVLFNSSFSHFLRDLFLPDPTKIQNSLFFPGRLCCDKAQQNGRRNE